MLKYQTLTENNTIKISRVTSNKNNKKFISVIFKRFDDNNSFNGGKYLFSGYEWQFDNIEDAKKHATFITLKHG